LPIVFSRSVRSIEGDGHRRSGVVFAIALAVAIGWTAWFTLARVTVIEVAEEARLEVDQAAHTVDAPVAGKISTFSLTLDQMVNAGDVVAELDTEQLKLELAQERALQAGFAPQLAALGLEITTAERGLDDHKSVAHVRVEEARARQREAQSALALATSELERTARLRAQNVVSEAELAKAKADVEQKRALVDAARLATPRIGAEQRATDSERKANIASRRKELAQLEAQNAKSVARIEELMHEISRRQIRAPIGGRVGEIASVRAGAVVKEGDKLGTIVPQGRIRIVAEFLPAAATGRVRAGQRAQMRPQGFPWTEYGVLRATVARVAHEPRSGRIRVELDVDSARSSIPIEHGLPGTLEVEIERVSPASLVLRTAGRRLSLPATTASSAHDRALP
jgi:membrane fusion protein (multidrug efflux system)